MLCDKEKRIKYKCSKCGREEPSALATEAVRLGWDLEKLKLVCATCMLNKIGHKESEDER